MLPVSLVPCTTQLQIDIKDRHGTNIQSMTLEILNFRVQFNARQSSNPKQVTSTVTYMLDVNHRVLFTLDDHITIIYGC